MIDWIQALMVCATVVVIGLSIIADIGSQWDLDRAYEASQPSTVRNEWGQLRHNPEFMCEATIRQWMEECK